ncbi:MAG: hypothetical protein JXA42_25250 [Anaerolineales bacterium]|nr:hypothetical protein [Anaerolineales bacterium]
MPDTTQNNSSNFPDQERPVQEIVDGADTIQDPIDNSPLPEIIDTWSRLKGPWRIFTMSEWVLRDCHSLFQEIFKQQNLNQKLTNMCASAAVHLALYGVAMGISNGWQQAIASAIKLPLLFLLTLLICLPTLYIFNLLYGSQLLFKQTAALMMSAIIVTATLALSFAPITWFLWMTVGNQYTILILINVIVIATSSGWGLVFLQRGMHTIQRRISNTSEKRILAIWLTIYAFVGTQLAWAIRPFFGVPGEPFVIVRGGGGTFIGSMITAIGWLIGDLLGLPSG